MLQTTVQAGDFQVTRAGRRTFFISGADQFQDSRLPGRNIGSKGLQRRFLRDRYFGWLPKLFNKNRKGFGELMRDGNGARIGIAMRNLEFHKNENGAYSFSGQCYSKRLEGEFLPGVLENSGIRPDGLSKDSFLVVEDFFRISIRRSKISLTIYASRPGSMAIESMPQGSPPPRRRLSQNLGSVVRGSAFLDCETDFYADPSTPRGVFRKITLGELRENMKMQPDDTLNPILRAIEALYG
jgi:hypothetical protein